MMDSKEREAVPEVNAKGEVKNPQGLYPTDLVSLRYTFATDSLSPDALDVVLSRN